MSESILKVENTSFTYDGARLIFDDVSFELEQGDIFSILGPNGAGKSTLLNCIGGLYAPQKGSVQLGGEDIHTIPHQKRALMIGFVSQIQNDTLDLSVRDYIVLGRAPHLGLMEMPGDEDYAVVDKLMDRFGITYLADQSILRTSGGERQQAQIARVLAQKPSLILMDEPTNHLDYGNQLKILRMICQLSKDEGITIVLTTHMPDHAILLKGKTGLLDREGHMLTGLTGDIITEDSLRRIYNDDIYLVQVDKVNRMVCIAGNVR
jgi:iron complex transport system ATP-binding protein